MASSPHPAEPAPPTPVPAGGTDYYLEAYKLLADKVKTEESAFWTRNQMFLTLNSGLVVILFGIRTLLGKEAAPAPAAPAATGQSVPTPPGGPQGSITIQQIVNQPTPSPSGSRSRILAIPLVAACAMGVFLCFLWTGLIERSKGMNDYLVAYMKDLEENHLSQIAIMRKYDTLFERIGKWWGGTGDVAFTRETVKLPWWGSLFRLFQVWLWIAIGFIMLWVVFGVVTIMYLV